MTTFGLMSGKLHTTLFLFKKIVKGEGQNFSKLTVKIAISGIAIGILVMLSASAIVNGFQREIPERLVAFWGHLQISRLDNNFSFESQPIIRNPIVERQVRELGSVNFVRTYATKAGIAKTNNAFEGVILKGISTDFDFGKFGVYNAYEGDSLNLHSETPELGVQISRSLANKLALDLNDDLPIYFIQQPPRVRKFKVVGIFNNATEQEGGRAFVLTDIRHIQKINNWKNDQIGGYEVGLNSLLNLSIMDDSIRNLLPINLETFTVAEQFPQLFSWLSLFDVNENVVLIIMLLVAGVNVISAMLILILERIPMIGTLKALGMTNHSLRRLFQLKALHIVVRGLFIGNFLAFTFYYIQTRYKIIKLPEESYYVPYVPMILETWQVIVLNVGTIVVCYLLISLPSFVIAGISPIKSIRFR